ncbi:hypothetical protein CQ046_07995 [Chryseobacterium sp. MYb7]|uniref:hypothetical protein n=1 Tax=Chryseobacterium sp. MYb7 TaxID=1827290 RepID=UPI000CFF6C1D|nr:hypothetical protein [Chryseobacterium sp. MYb7]PRB04157.1 hypothetical protein CQ046_07995 [Chryseobacterium sp. MYb7]
MKAKYFISALISLFFSVTALAQIGINTSNPNPTAALDISSNSKGLLIPRLTTAQRDAITTPADGLQIFNSTIGCLQTYSTLANSWGSLCGGSSSGTFISRFLAFKTVDQSMPVNNKKYDITFDNVAFNDMANFGGSYNSSTGGFTLPAGLYEITYSLVIFLNNTNFTDAPATAPITISSFENIAGDANGTIISGVDVQNNKGTTTADTRNSTVLKTFYLKTTATATFYLKELSYNGTGATLSTSKFFNGTGSGYNQSHLSNYISIKQLK